MAVKSTEIEIEIGIGLDILASFKLLIELRRLATVFLVAWGVSFKIKISLEDKLWFPWYYTIFSTYDQSLFFHWFLSNSCYHSSPSFKVMSIISKSTQTLYDESWSIQPAKLVSEIGEKSVRPFSSKSWIIFHGLILVIPAVFSNN